MNFKYLAQKTQTLQVNISDFILVVECIYQQLVRHINYSNNKLQTAQDPTGVIHWHHVRNKHLKIKHMQLEINFEGWLYTLVAVYKYTGTGIPAGLRGARYQSEGMFSTGGEKDRNRSLCAAQMQDS